MDNHWYQKYSNKRRIKGWRSFKRISASLWEGKTSLVQTVLIYFSKNPTSKLASLTWPFDSHSITKHYAGCCYCCWRCAFPYSMTSLFQQKYSWLEILSCSSAPAGVAKKSSQRMLAVQCAAQIAFGCSSPCYLHAAFWHLWAKFVFHDRGRTPWIYLAYLFMLYCCRLLLKVYGSGLLQHHD